MENERRIRKKHSHNGAIALMATLVVLMVFSVILLFLPEKEPETKKAKPTPTVTPTEAPAEEEYLAVVLSLDKENKIVKVYGAETGEETNLVYTGGTTFYDGYGVQITASQLKAGELYRFTINTKEEWISTAEEAVDRSENKGKDGVWEKTGIDSLAITPEKLVFRNQNYRYTEALCVMSNGQRISLSDVNPKTDILTIRGKGSVVYEIIVTKGHGTITLKNFEDFKGGTIAIGNAWVDTVSEEGTYTMREGTYTVSVVSGDYSAKKEIIVQRDQITEFDLFEYGRGPIQTCRLTFTVEPLGATLYIDGEKTPYTDGVELDYGTYKIEFAEGGYVSYTATIRVEEPTMHLNVYLPETPVAPPEEDDTDGESDAGSAGSQPEKPKQTSVSIRDFGDYTLDLDYAVYITEPEGAEVYLDGIYLGIVPVDFEKILGGFEITIIRPDGKDKTFQLKGTDNAMDSWYSFTWED